MNESKKGSSLEKILHLVEDNQDFRKMLQCRVQRTALCILNPRLSTIKLTQLEHTTGAIPSRYIEKILVSSDLIDELRSSDLDLSEANGIFSIRGIQIVPISSQLQPLLYPLRGVDEFRTVGINLYAPDFFSRLEDYLTPRQVNAVRIESRYSPARPLIIHAVRLCNLTTLVECEDFIDLAPQIEVARPEEEVRAPEQPNREEMTALWRGPGGLMHPVRLEEVGGSIAAAPARQDADNRRSLAPLRKAIDSARNKAKGIFDRLTKRKDEDSLL